MKVVVYERTSGDEDEGQDVRAQLAQTVGRAKSAGYEVVDSFFDEDVSGDVPWEDRPGLKKALKLAGEAHVALLVRELSRLCRFRPDVTVALIGGIDEVLVGRVADLARVGGVLAPRSLPGLDALVVLDKPHWARLGGAWVVQDDSADLVRFIDAWAPWVEKRRTVERSRLAMVEIMSGRRATKSGKPPGRPRIHVEPAHLEEARAVLARGGSMAEAHRRVLELRGYYTAKDPRTQEARDVSRATLGVLLGRYSVRNPDVSETPAAPGAGVSGGDGAVPDNSADGGGSS